MGVSFTKTLAKLGSDLKKPDATTVLDKEHYMDVIGDMSPSEMIMIGKQTSEKLTKLNVRTIRQLANADRDALRHIFGVVADNMINAAQGVETEEVKHYYDIRIPKSVSNGTTTPRDIKTLDEAKIVIYALADMVALRLRSYNLVANGIGLSIKNPALQWTSKQIPLSPANANSGAIAKSAISLIEKYTISTIPFAQSPCLQSGWKTKTACKSVFSTSRTTKPTNLKKQSTIYAQSTATARCSAVSCLKTISRATCTRTTISDLFIKAKQPETQLEHNLHNFHKTTRHEHDLQHISCFVLLKINVFSLISPFFGRTILYQYTYRVV